MNAAPKKSPAEQIACRMEIVKALRAGKRPDEVRAELGVTKHVITYACKLSGTSTRQLVNEALAAKIKAGASLDEACKYFRVSKERALAACFHARVNVHVHQTSS